MHLIQRPVLTRCAEVTFGLGKLGSAGKGSCVAFCAPPSGRFAQLASAVFVSLVAIGKQCCQRYLWARSIAILFLCFFKLAASIGRTVAAG
jgi:hypothetical protein